MTWSQNEKIKSKVHPRTGHEGPESEQKHLSTLSIASALDAGGWSTSRPSRSLPMGKRPGTNCTGGWVGPRAGLDRCGKSRLHRDSIPNRPARSQSLYRLSYLGPPLCIVLMYKVFQGRDITANVYQCVCSVAGWVQNRRFYFFNPCYAQLERVEKVQVVYIVIKIWGFECVAYGE